MDALPWTWAREVSDEAIALFVCLARCMENPKLASVRATALDGRKIILRKLNKK